MNTKVIKQELLQNLKDVFGYDNIALTNDDRSWESLEVKVTVNNQNYHIDIDFGMNDGFFQVRNKGYDIGNFSSKTKESLKTAVETINYFLN